MQSLTGGTLLARDREFICLYRGKDFLPPVVSSAIEERRKYGIHAEKLKSEHSTSIETTPRGPNEHSEISDNKKKVLPEPRKLTFAEASARRTSLKLSMVRSF